MAAKGARLGHHRTARGHRRTRRLAAYTRGHWSVEDKSHYVRDVTFGEDRSNTPTGDAPANLATCRNLVIGAFHTAGHTNIAHARSLQANLRVPIT
jgi:hypothetical protein